MISSNLSGNDIWDKQDLLQLNTPYKQCLREFWKKEKKDNNYLHKSIQKHDIYYQAYSQTQNTL